MTHSITGQNQTGPDCLALSLTTLPPPKAVHCFSSPRCAALLGLPALMDGPTSQPPFHSFLDVGLLAS